jgi:hypothetical protein
LSRFFYAPPVSLKQIFFSVCSVSLARIKLICTGIKDSSFSARLMEVAFDAGGRMFPSSALS